MSKLNRFIDTILNVRSVGVVTAVTLVSGLLITSQGLRLRALRHTKSAPRSGDASMGESSSAILLDSIVSLVENYYVDKERVSGDKLVSGAMRSLAYAIPELRYEDSESSYSIAYHGERIEFNKTQELEYGEILGRLKSLIGFSDRIGVTTLVNSGGNLMLGSERDATTMVLNALLSSLDAHSSLLSSAAYEELREGTEGSFGGLGVLVGVRDQVLTVLKPLPRSPAERVGVHKFDKILSIDGFNTYGLSLDKLVPHMRGEPGSVARLTTLPQGARSPRSISLTREVIEVDSVEAIEHHVGDTHVLRLVVDNFAFRTSREMWDHMRKFKRKYPLSGLIIDLRGNPGGLLDQSVLVSDLFLDQGVVVSTKGRREEVERATRAQSENDYPIVVLMNEDSASASEIVAGALRDNGRAVIVGQPSFGKGSVQTVFELPEQRALKLTIARYYTPAEKSIQNVGIMPDVWIQPVYEMSENANMFGPYRYVNEMLLPNHLSAVSTPDADANFATVKGYYLAKPTSKEDNAIKHDPELEIALGILDKTRRAYGHTLPAGARRASHWLALASGEIKERVDVMTGRAVDWLRKNHNIKWRQDVRSAANKVPLALQITAPESGLRGFVGESMMVPWRISNLGTETAENVSVFIQSQISGMETREVLVGSVAPGQSREGQIKIQIPPGMAPGLHYVNAGIAVDARALTNAQGEFLVAIDESRAARLVASASFIDGAGSRVSQALDGSEKATLKVTVENSSETVARQVRVSLANLAGSQIKVADHEFEVGTMAPGSKREVEFFVEARPPLESSVVTVGVQVIQASQGSGAFKIVDVPTSGSIAEARASRNLSH